MNVENLNKLIAHLEAQPAGAINMGWVAVEEHPECGTCGCILGHATVLFGLDCYFSELDLSQTLDINDGVRIRLLMPEHWSAEKTGVRRYPASRVIATLKRLRDHYLETGEAKVDWGPEPGEEPIPATVRVPELPDELTRLLEAPAALDLAEPRP